jgi:hypothetical protein
MILNRNRTFALAAALSAALAAAGCGSRASSAQGSLKGSAMVSAALNLATGVDHVSLTITGPENRAAQPLNKVDDTNYQVTVAALTPGSGYTFLVQGFDASNSVVLSGQSAHVTIVAGQTAQVPIILHETAQPTGPTAKLPVLDGLSASAAQVEQNTDVAVSVTAHSPESHTLAYQWSDSCGGAFVNATAGSTTWHSPGTNTVCQLSVRVADSANSTSVTGYLVIRVGTQTGDANVTATIDTFPIMSIGVIDQFVVFQEPAPANLTQGVTADIAAMASDPDGSMVTYAWTSTCDKGTGTFSPNASTLSPVTFHNDDPTAACTLTLTVTDTSNQRISGTIDLVGYRCANVTCSGGQTCDPADGVCKAPPPQARAYGYVYDYRTTTAQSIATGSDVLFSNNGPLQGITHDAGSSNIVVSEAGDYEITFSVNTTGNNPQSWGIAVNGTVQAYFNAAGQSLPFTSSLLTLDAGDVVSLRNVGTIPNPANTRLNVNSIWMQFDKVASAYGHVFDYRTDTNQTITVGHDALFNSNGPLRGMTHDGGTSNITLGEPGTYNIAFAFNSSANNPEYWGVAVNGTVVASFQSAGQSGAGDVDLTLNAGDIISLRNVGTLPDPANTRLNGLSTWMVLRDFSGAHGYAYQINGENIQVGTDVTYSNDGPLQGVAHTPGTAQLAVTDAGTYDITFGINSNANNPQLWGVAVNGAVVQTFGAAGQNIFGGTELTLAAGDVVTIRNVGTVPNPAVLRTTGNSGWVEIKQVD